MGVQSSENNRGDPYRFFDFFFTYDIYISLKSFVELFLMVPNLLVKVYCHREPPAGVRVKVRVRVRVRVII